MVELGEDLWPERLSHDQLCLLGAKDLGSAQASKSSHQPRFVAMAHQPGRPDTLSPSTSTHPTHRRHISWHNQPHSPSLQSSKFQTGLDACCVSESTWLVNALGHHR